MGLKGIIPETPKHHSPVFKNVNNIIIASNRMALMEAKNLTEKYGYYTKILTHSLSGDARKAGEYLALQAIKHKNYMKKKGLKKMCIITGGETTVRVTGKGKGGRNQELALTFASKIKGIPGITLLSAGTDGIDGNTDAAGAIVDGFTIEKGNSMGLNYQDYQKNNDSYNFLKATGNLIFTGPTGTNVMDMQIMIIRMSR
jgi:hydroxypyruvate reductase/glycerate 2-kinase